ncbi:MAG TPA: LPS export ABC transporter periplasmic protein LptC [Nitrospirota bacterium]|nr:LPS export ABC transporter periplasmic protein LptC [Nitrospirota bacterium]
MMKQVSRAKLFLILVILALLSASAAYMMQNPGVRKAPVPVKQVKHDQTEVVIDGFRYARNDGGTENWELKARRAEMKKETGMANLRDLEATFSGNNGTVLTLKADEGTFDSNSKDVRLDGRGGGVTVTSNSGYTIDSESLSWDNEKRVLSTDDKVTLSGKNIKIEGRGLVARPDLQEVRFNNGVRTVFSASK